MFLKRCFTLRSVLRQRLPFSRQYRLLSSNTKPLPSEINAVKEALKNANTNPTDSPKMLIGFTCKCCSTRTHRLMNRQAYEKGIVLVECPGCQTRHLIADNLGWFKDTPQAAKKIEEMPEVGAIRRKLDLTEAEAENLLEILKEPNVLNKSE